MALYATMDAEGRATGFFDDTIHGDTIPAGATQIGADLYQAWIANIQTQALVGGALVAVPIAITQPTAEEIAAALKESARAALAASDTTLVRCLEHGVAIPAEWVAYRAELRPIAAGASSAALPVRPSYPAGT